MKSLKRVTGTFNGTGAACYLCIGAIPAYAKLIDIEVATNPLFVEWYRDMIGQVLAYGGILMTGSTGVYTKKTTTGIFPYEGGDLMTSANQTSTGYGDGVYLGWDEANYQADYTYGAVAKGTPINKWYFDGTLSGHFNSNGVASSCRIGLGSIIRIKEDSTGLVKEAGLTALTSSPTFTTASYVTLSRAIGTGTITFIGGMYQLAPIALGKTTPAGIYVADTTVNVNDDSILFDIQMEP